MKNLIGKRLYRLNQAGVPTFWCVLLKNTRYYIHSGLVNGNSTPILKNETEEALNKRYHDKLNEGYVLNHTLLSEDSFIKTLSNDRTTEQGYLKPMKAQPYKPGCMKFPVYVQGKINGNRGTPIHVKYQSQDMFDLGYEGFVFRSMGGEEYRINYLAALLNAAAKQNPYIKELSFDGELFIPKTKVATISGAARNPSNPLHSQLSFISFDLMNDEKQSSRLGELYATCENLFPMLHLDMDINKITPNIYILASTMIDKEEDVIPLRDIAIKNNFEGIILRDPSAYYGYGKRVKTMRKLKKETFKHFKILDIVPRNEEDGLPVFVLQNDITSESFESSSNGTHQQQYLALRYKADLIGSTILVRFYERTINDLPLHATVFLTNDN